MPEFVDRNLLRIGGVDFYYAVPLIDIPPRHLGIAKPRLLLDAYIDLWQELCPRRIVELGVCQGGSTALLAELGGAERIVSLELSESRVEALDRYIAERGASDIVHPWYGVDQADRERLRTIVTDEFGSAALDLVIDDASHKYHESRASFEVLFPRVRPGGLYLLEDWPWQHIVAANLTQLLETRDDVRREIEQRMIDEGRTAPDTPMSRLVMELVIARAISGELVAELVVGPHWVAVRRGPAVLDPGSFRLADHAADHLGVLAPVR